MFGYALQELAWVLAILGLPILMAWLWTQYQDRKRRKYRESWERMVNNLHIQMTDGYRKGYADEIARQSQKRKDDYIFNTVEEYRNATR